MERQVGVLLAGDAQPLWIKVEALDGEVRPQVLDVPAGADCHVKESVAGRFLLASMISISRNESAW